MAFYSTPVLMVLITAAVFIDGSVADIPSGGSGSITKDHITSIFRNTQAALDKIRNPSTRLGSQYKNATREYLRLQLSGIASQANGTFNEQPYTTSVYQDDGKNTIEVDGVNFIVVYKGSKKESEDEPLMIIANYDTEKNDNNPIDDNGSGVVALIVLADVLAKDIRDKRVKLDRTIIIVASDTSLGKDENGKPSNGKVGAGEIAKEWLPEFMSQRRSFRGAIVLDNIMNYNNTPRSQIATDFSKAFPSAYKLMADSEFTGDFVGVVHRDDALDKPLVAAFERGWTKAMKQTKGKDDLVADPRLIKFQFQSTTAISGAEIHFLRSDQTEFWNHHVRAGSKMYPAILVTDTEHYRTSPCSNFGQCQLDRMLTDQNVDFLKRIIMSVYETAVLSQQGNSSGSSTISAMSFLTICFGILLRYLHSFML